MRSTRHVLIAKCFAATDGLMPRRATIVHTCTAYSEGVRTERPNMLDAWAAFDAAHST
jgi:hypothetical protein